jgi:hypothetical protein
MTLEEIDEPNLQGPGGRAETPLRFRADMDTDCLKVYCVPCHEVPAVEHDCPNGDGNLDEKVNP